MAQKLLLLLMPPSVIVKRIDKSIRVQGVRIADYASYEPTQDRSKALNLPDDT